ncbi:37S ribosomal protein S16, mitochondrial [Coniothyrium glycines]
MVLRIRLARFGKKHAPFYNIVVAHARTSRSSRPLEVLGTYSPTPLAPLPGSTAAARPWKDVKLDISRARYWVGVGAQPSDTAWRLLSMVGVLEPRWRVSEKMGKVVRSGKSAAGSLVGEGEGDKVEV